MTEPRSPSIHDDPSLRERIRSTLADVEAALAASAHHRFEDLSPKALAEIGILKARQGELRGMLGIPSESLAVTLPLDVLESLIFTCQRFMPGNLKPHDRKMLAIAVEEVRMVREMVGEKVGEPTREG